MNANSFDPMGTPFTEEPLNTTTGPVVAPTGTTQLNIVSLMYVILVALTPLNATASGIPPASGPSFVPVMTTVVPTAPDAGAISVMFARKEFVMSLANLVPSPPQPVEDKSAHPQIAATRSDLDKEFRIIFPPG